MASNDLINVHKHGIELDPQKKKVKCNYCDKVVSGFHRLKCHLGGIRGDVISCLKVPNDVKKVFKTELMDKKMKKLKRKLIPDTDVVNCNEADTQINRFEGDLLCEGGCLLENGGVETASLSKKIVFSEVCTNGTKDSPENEIKKCVGRYFYGTGNKFDHVEEFCFLEMISSVFGHGQMMNNIPSCQELKGWILQDSLEKMQQYVKTVKQSWESTGCSILLDGWTDSMDRNLVNILVNCPKGVVYLKSSDISTFIGNVDAMQLFLEEVLQEVGVENVIQIITYSTSDFMELVGKRIMEKHKHLCWTVSASNCIELMLEKFGMMRSIEDVLGKTIIIMKFIWNHATALKHLRAFDCVHNLVKPSKITSIVPYLTLENFVSNKESLKRLLASPDWKASAVSTSTEGKIVAGLVANSLFWNEATVALKASIPLIRALQLIYENNKPQTGHLFKIISQAKEKIKEEFEHKKSLYMPFWREIDEIWENHLCSPLHSAGCFLNPIHFSSSSSNPYIASDMHRCIFHMGGDLRVQDLIKLQIEKYQMAIGTSCKNTIYPQLYFSPEFWWSRHGGEYPELQRVAIRILSQTCDGASKFNLRRSLAELLLTNGPEQIEIEALTALTFVHYNMRLQNFISGRKNGILIGSIDPQSGWNYAGDIMINQLR